MTCLIEVPSPTHDFVLESVKLYIYVQEMLKDILIDENIQRYFLELKMYQLCKEILT